MPRRFQIDIRYVAPVFITIILLVAQLGYGVLESYPQTLLAIGCSLADGDRPEPAGLQEVAAPGERLRVGHQRRHPAALAALLAVRAVRRPFHRSPSTCCG